MQQLAREEAAIDRQIERKIRLLAVMQRARRAGLEPPPVDATAAETAAPEPNPPEESHAPENAGEEGN